MASQTGNERLRDAALRHHLQVNRLAAREARNIIGQLEEADEELERLIMSRMGERALAAGVGTERMLELQRSIRELRTELMRDLHKAVRDRTVELGKQEVEFERQMIQAAMPVDLDLATVPVARVREVVRSQPFAGGANSARTLSQWFENLEAADRLRIRDAVQMASTLGESPGEATTRIARATKLTRQNAEMVARSGLNHISNATRGEIHKENSHVIRLLMVSATLDGRTTAVCRARDGKFVAVSGEVPADQPALDPQSARPPFHVGCRTVMIPVVDPDLLAEQLPERPFVRDTRTRRQREIDFRAQAKSKAGGRWSDLSRAERNALIRTERKAWANANVGRVPGTTNYDDWIKNQSAAFQDDVLGPSRARAFRKGEVTLDDMIDRNGTPLSLAEINRRNQLSLEELESTGRLHPDVPSFDEVVESGGTKATRVGADALPGIVDSKGDLITPTNVRKMDRLRSKFRQGQDVVDDLGDVTLRVGQGDVFEIVDGKHRLLLGREFPNIKMRIRILADEQ